MTPVAKGWDEAHLAEVPAVELLDQLAAVAYAGEPVAVQQVVIAVQHLRLLGQHILHLADHTVHDLHHPPQLPGARQHRLLNELILVDRIGLRLHRAKRLENESQRDP